MITCLQAIEERLQKDQKDMLQRIYEPMEVMTPLSNARRYTCVLKDGEIRSYGRLYQVKAHQGGQKAYLSSVDGGISWVKKYSNGEMEACTYFSKADVYVGVVDGMYGESGLWALRSTIGPDDKNPERIKIADGRYNCAFLPIQSAFSNRIWFTVDEKVGDVGTIPTFCYSDDFGKTWKVRKIEEIPPFEMEYPHKGVRWCKGSGNEPYAVELSENELMMLIRTPHDSFYQSFSHDGGDTWTKPQPSTFYGTNTTAFSLRLKDGRVLVFWNNTKPLPEVDHTKTQPPMDNWVVDGFGEDVFTNRDAAHVAISEDGGKTFIGYRELFLNPVRNNADFRYVGGAKESNDKSVHQFQAFELPFHKVLVCVGQNPVSRRALIFDVDWLYQTERKEDFLLGLQNVSSHTYVKSVSGHTVSFIGNGHCAWNRAQSAYMLPDPDGGYGEAVYLCKRHDERLFNDISGIVWNFPCAKQGQVSVEIKILEKQATVILADRWYNACDPYVAEFAPFAFTLDKEEVGDSFACVDIRFDLEKNTAYVFINGEQKKTISMQQSCSTGISYLLLQCATQEDSKGFYIKSMQKR